MTALVQALYRSKTLKAEARLDPMTMVLLFCGAGLLVSLTLVACGFDLGFYFI